MRLARRLLLRGRLTEGGGAPRPPWALDEAAFIERCSRCDACIRRCPEGIIRRGDGGFPEVSFSDSGCTFCGRCVSVCVPHALAAQRPWQLTLTIAESCIAKRGSVCMSCAEACIERALRLPLVAGGVATPQFDPQRCSGCGFCVGPCPSGAITLQQEVTAR